MSYNSHNFALIEKYSVFENIRIPLSYSKKYNKKEAREKTQLLTKKIGIHDRLKELVHHLSGGQRQRVAIARALINDPDIILADEPTEALDSETTKEIMLLLKKLCNEGKTILIVTHDTNVADYCHYTINTKDGKLV
ncbi:ABC transporter ATP-binding protein [Pontibacillus litoralis]|uniref:Peptide ABC transporter ATP-binding protein n=1 Tax=Pontibacillus litoralis JSM 072002 TaxID=1385512 RepID=A0A0A5G6T8_9BACI|nr:ABC transporter ATP-binding protein [Pontibacillus litoralis]KGX86883.1 peptide ABC transporter ATP-binding protein [Pontibacillus litoralis JSM 072002]